MARLLNSAYGGFLALAARSWPTGNACSGSTPALRAPLPQGAKYRLEPLSWEGASHLLQGAGATADRLFLEASVRRFPLRRTAAHDGASSERYHCARSASPRAYSPAARTCQHVTASGVIPAHQVGLDRVLAEQHCHGIVDVSRCNVAVRVHALQSLNQSLFECVGHYMIHMTFPARLRKA